MGPSYPYRSFPLDLPLLLEGEDPQWFPFLQNPFPITLVLDGLATLQMVRAPFLPKTLPESSFLSKTSHHHLNYSTCSHSATSRGGVLFVSSFLRLPNVSNSAQSQGRRYSLCGRPPLRQLAPPCARVIFSSKRSAGARRRFSTAHNTPHT